MEKTLLQMKKVAHQPEDDEEEEEDNEDHKVRETHVEQWGVYANLQP